MSTTQHQFPVPSTYNYQSPAVGATRGSTQGTTTLIGETRTPQSYSFQTSIQNTTQVQNTMRGSTQNTVSYTFQQNYNYPYEFRYPFIQPLIGQTRSPFTYQIQNTTTGQTRFPFTYPYRSPAIGVKENEPISYPYIANARQPVRYSVQNTVNYVYQSPSIVQTPANGTRPISQVAEVKGVFFKDTDGVVKKTQEVYFKKDSSTVEKTHQTIPISQMNK